MIDNSVIKIDNKNYLVVDTILVEGFKYVFCSNENDVNDFIIQKEIYENDKSYLVNLKNEEEFLRVMQLFLDKNN